MKRVNELEFFKDGKSYRKNKNKLRAAITALNALGKHNLHVFGDGKIRLHHRGKYFDYSPHTGGWSYTRSTNKKWRNSVSVRDFFEQVNEFCDWYENKDNLPPREKIIYPISMQLEDRIVFGKYKGLTLKAIRDRDPAYINWCLKKEIIKTDEDLLG